jgi:hypothetical protein
MADPAQLSVIAARIANYYSPGADPDTSGQYVVRCPAHDDHTPSLRIWTSDRLHIDCRAKCPREAVEECFVRDGVVKLEDLHHLRNSPPRQGTKLKLTSIIPAPSEPDWSTVTMTVKGGGEYYTPDHIYTYFNESSQPVFWVLRKDKGENGREPTKKLVMPYSAVMFAGGKPGFAFIDPKGIQLPLYNLPMLSKRPSSRVIIFEGEKTADAGSALFPHSVCMTWAHGSLTGSIAKTDWTTLKGRDVILWPDNDQVSITGMHQIASVLAAGGNYPRIVFRKIQEDLPPKWDVADWKASDQVNLNEMLHGAYQLTPNDIAPVDMIADQGQVKKIIEEFDRKYVRLKTNRGLSYVNIQEFSPANSGFPFMEFSGMSLINEVETDKIIMRLSGQQEKSQVIKKIELFMEAPEKIICRDHIYDPSTDERIIFRNGSNYLNTYIGLACPPMENQPSKKELEQASARVSCFFEHIRLSMSELNYNWFMIFLRHLVQHPGVKPEVIPILTGPEGSGKSVIHRTLVHALGRSNATPATVETILGNFNALLDNKLLVSCDEFTLDRAEARTLLKNLMDLADGPGTPITRKGIDSVVKELPTRFILTTNHENPLELVSGQRRFALMRVDNPLLKRTSGGVIEDNDYFGPIHALWKQPDRLADILNVLKWGEKVSERMPRPPDSKEQRSVIVSRDPSVDIIRGWLDDMELPRHSIYELGEQPEDSDFTHQTIKVPIWMLRDALDAELRKRGPGVDRSQIALGKTIRRFFRTTPDGLPGARPKGRLRLRHRATGSIESIITDYVYVPPAMEARKDYEREVGREVSWSTPVPPFVNKPAEVVNHPSSPKTDKSDII